MLGWGATAAAVAPFGRRSLTLPAISFPNPHRGADDDVDISDRFFVRSRSRGRLSYKQEHRIALDVEDNGLISQFLNFSSHLVIQRPGGLSGWSDEREMRERIANYSAEKFSHNYHGYRKCNSSATALAVTRRATVARRKKRDGGLVSGPIATAVVTGMIGEHLIHLSL
ncbi:unnamed protein product [Heligmosomoides polygyrus]|uniref:Uncharacterized protein n=1 Tax=Heligmosomoides polygyrus TaxID=6339 RepID=A0A183GV48_HELPZ|nr:unnamed protein product [Heligmosomoides polygyrus]